MSEKVQTGVREQLWHGITNPSATLRDFFQPELPENPVEFATVLAEERKVIYQRRVARGFTARGSSHPDGLTGLALSGGGIRSATYCLGVLQALNQCGLLKGFDYLSTVSGGGFTGGWLTAWLCRHPQPFPPKEGLASDRRSPTPQEREVVDREALSDRKAAGVDALRHLRLYANYLTPRKGFLSVDTWKAASTIGRDLILTNAVLLPILLAVILLSDVYFIIFDPTWVKSDELVMRNRVRAWLVLLPIGAVAAWFLALSAMWLRFVRKGRSFNTIAVAVSIGSLVAMALFGTRVAQVTSTGTLAGRQTPVDLLWTWAAWFKDDGFGWLTIGWFVVLIALMSYAIAAWGGDEMENARVRARLERCQTALVIGGVAMALILALGAYGHEFGLFLRANGRDRTLAFLADNARWITLATATLGSLYTVFNLSPSATADARSTGRPSKFTDLVLAITPIAVLMVLALTASFAAHAAIGRLMDESRRAGALQALRLCSGTLVILCAYAVARESRFETMKMRKDIRLLTRVGAVALGVLLALAIGELAGGWWYVAAVALFAIFALTLHRRQLGRLGNTRPAWLLGAGFTVLALMESVRLPGVGETEGITIAIPLIGAVFAWVFAIGWFADPNAISLHAFYRARLVSGFLGASNEERSRQLKDIRDFDEKDDLRLSCAAGAHIAGPYHLINATLNLTAGRDLASSQRSSDRFLLSPLFCGSSRTAYRPTSKYMDDALQLGTAMAVSGAAVSPVMGSVSPTASLSMLLTILNVRLGFWAPTPNKPRWREESASLWPLHLMFEMTSQTNELASYCYLTDGGHFDNTGLYSLVERGCRNIIVADCGADAKPCFEDLGTAIRRCRIDFGTAIDIDLSPAMAEKPADRQPVLVGRITYDSRHADALGLDGLQGTLIVLKPSVGDRDSADVRQYQLQNTAFPQHVTTDQWFDEAQFESYRRLGELTALRILQQDQEVVASLKAFDARPSAGTLNTVFEDLGRALGLKKSRAAAHA